MNWGMILWNEEPLKWRGFPDCPFPFSPVHRALKTTLETSGEDVKNTLETSGEDVKTTLETSGEDEKT